MSKQIKIICDGCEEDFQPLFDIGDSHIELEIFADRNHAKEISKLEGVYHFCNLDCLKMWEHLKSTIKIK